jgi:ABC-2 type transport system permease protein
MLPGKRRRLFRPAIVSPGTALVVKESRQILRDASSIAVGIVLPVVLILLFGYGLSLDVKNIPRWRTPPDAAELVSAFALSPYFKIRTVSTMAQAQELMVARRWTE